MCSHTGDGSRADFQPGLRVSTLVPAHREQRQAHREQRQAHREQRQKWKDSCEGHC